MTTHQMGITRIFDAPVELVWTAWTDPEQVRRWWGPTGFSCPLARMDVREGGTSLVCMRSPDGHDVYNTWTYQRVTPMRRLEFVQRFADQDANPLDPDDLGLPPGIPKQVPHVLTFQPAGEDRTEFTVTEHGYPNEEIVAISRAGMEQVLDKLAATLR
jgi:uncharacterized protein YndB with AHSA1/START domain